MLMSSFSTLSVLITPFVGILAGLPHAAGQMYRDGKIYDICEIGLSSSYFDCEVHVA